MKHRLINNQQGTPTRRLIVFFNGWAMDDTVASYLLRPGYDVLVLWDYTDMHFEANWLEGYDEICLLAWSFGVFAASCVMGPFDDKITRRIAVNGTPRPIDSHYGIHPRVVDVTLRALRTPAGREYVESLTTDAPTAVTEAFARNRDLDDVIAELEAVKTHATLAHDESLRWDYAFISGQDTTMPPRRQRDYWALHPETQVVDVPTGAHCIDIAEIACRYIIDKTLVQQRFGNAVNTYAANAHIQRRIANKIYALAKSKGLKGNVLEIGSGTGALTQLFADDVAQALLLDVVDYGMPVPANAQFVQCDAESKIRQLPDNAYDVVLSASTMQWFNSQTAFLRHVARVLKPGGVAVISTFGEDNLPELAQFVAQQLPSHSADTFRAVLAAIDGVADIDIAAEDIAIDFADARQMLRHLQQTGVTGISRDGQASARAILNTMSGPCRLTYRPIYLTFSKL